MQTIEVTDEQYLVIQQLREEISEQVVGEYGFVRERDAVQFLIDALEEGVDDAVDGDGTFDASAAFAAAEAVDAGDDTGVNAIEGDPEADGDAEDGESITYAEDDAESDAEGEGGADAETAAGEGAESDTRSATDDESDTPSDEAAGNGDAAAADERGAVADDGSGGTADDDDKLDKMMNLLETHDDKWEESPSADYRYRVALPDGTTEDVQTKDDVRALLFKNY